MLWKMPVAPIAAGSWVVPFAERNNNDQNVLVASVMMVVGLVEPT